MWSSLFELRMYERHRPRSNGDLHADPGQAGPSAGLVQAPASLGQIATHARACMNLLLGGSNTSQMLLEADLQRYFRDINMIHENALAAPSSSTELYCRLLASLEPGSDSF